MRFYIDLDTLELVESPADNRAVTQVEGKRGDATPMVVTFLRDGAAEDLPALSVLTFGAKPEGKYDADAVVLDSTFALVGDNYEASPSFSTVGLDALFLIDSDDSNDPPYVDLMAEFTWQVGSGTPTSSKTFRFRVQNDVIRGDESGPTGISEGTPVNEVVAVAASGTFTFAGLPSDGDSITIGGRVYGFISAGPGLEDQIIIGASLNDLLDELSDAITNGASGYITDPDELVTAARSGSNLVVTSRIVGTIGNSYLIDESGTNITKSGTNLTGGANAVTATPGRPGSMRIDTSFLYVVSEAPAGIPTWRKIAHSAL